MNAISAAIIVFAAAALFQGSEAAGNHYKGGVQWLAIIVGLAGFVAWIRAYRSDR